MEQPTWHVPSSARTHSDPQAQFYADPRTGTAVGYASVVEPDISTVPVVGHASSEAAGHGTRVSSQSIEEWMSGLHSEPVNHAMSRVHQPAAPAPSAPDPGTTADGSKGRHRSPDNRTPVTGHTIIQDFLASIVVFLVALPLCIGIAVASGVPAEIGIITGIIGGLVAGAMPGSSLQVSGPAAGLTVIVFDAVQSHGVGSLGVIVLGAGLLQIGMAVGRIGKWFQAITQSVVQGMLAGIGILILIGQLYPLAGLKSPGKALDNLAGLPHLVTQVFTDHRYGTTATLGLVGLLIIVFWTKAPKRVRMIPGALVAVFAAAWLAAVLELPVTKLQVGSLLDAVTTPSVATIAGLADPGLLGLAFAFALIASAESLFSASATDRMHNGPRTQYNPELAAQGTGNVVAGMLGALPMTAVIVRSAANVHAGGKTKLSRVLHGVWMAGFALLAPGLLSLIPITVLAAILVYSGWKLLNPSQFKAMWAQDRSETAIAVATAVAIVATDLLEGVAIGMVLTVGKLAWNMSHMSMSSEYQPMAGRQQQAAAVLRLTGSATFLRLPTLLERLDRLTGKCLHLDMRHVFHIDLATRTAVETWARRRRREGVEVLISLPPGADKNFEPLDAH